MPVDADGGMKTIPILTEDTSEWTTQEIMDHQVAHSLLCELVQYEKDAYNPNEETQDSTAVVKEEPESQSVALKDPAMRKKKKNLNIRDC